MVSVPKASDDLDLEEQLIKETCSGWDNLVISRTLSAFYTCEIATKGIRLILE